MERADNISLDKGINIAFLFMLGMNCRSGAC